MHSRAKKSLEKLITGNLTEAEKNYIKVAFELGYNEGRHSLSTEEALDECRKWRMTDEEEKSLL